jgi:hypothetical protein
MPLICVDSTCAWRSKCPATPLWPRRLAMLTGHPALSNPPLNCTSTFLALPKERAAVDRRPPSRD